MVSGFPCYFCQLVAITFLISYFGFYLGLSLCTDVPLSSSLALLLIFLCEREDVCTWISGL